MAEPPLCRLLAWDSDFFGVRVARVHPGRLTPATASAVMGWCEAHAIDLLYFLADADDPLTIGLAEDYGFRLVDLRVTLDRPLDGAQALRAPDAVRPVRPADLPALQAIARTGFAQSRFYADPRIPDERAAALYETWVTQRAQDPAAHVLVAEMEGQAAGFITCLRSGAQGTIDLFAVGEGARGRGLGQALVSAALDWFAGQGAAGVSVVTQGRNLAAQRLYQRCGFVTCAMQLWYHRWFAPENTPAAQPDGTEW